MSGFLGVNLNWPRSASRVAEPVRLLFGLLAMTQMMCGPPDMERERAFSQPLNKSRHVEATH